MTRTDIHKSFSNRCKAEELLAILAKLKEDGLIQNQRIERQGSGRPRELWFCVRKN